MNKLSYFPEEWQTVEEKDVEAYGARDGWIYCIRHHNKDGGMVPPMEAYAVVVGHDGDVIDWCHTNDPQELTLWARSYQK
ncbi:Hypothetical Protein OBI_RACECAR_40 [Arthrobacter phage Racecar]|nr:hypothetical protein PBI_RACECAR_121 [Arthrobacter phage Racecar]QFG12796.1 hypothetical protein PBI_MIMI_118 [Arthrobacter phage Mimi]